MLIHDDALGEAALKLITKTIYTEVLHVESTLGECCFACIREQAQTELIYKTRMALQVITGICEADAIELAEWIYKDENETRIDKCLADEIVKGASYKISFFDGKLISSLEQKQIQSNPSS